MNVNTPKGHTEYVLPRAEALIAGTLALMTAHAQACCEDRRQLMAAKIVANLSQVIELPAMSPQFQAAMWNLRTHWQGLRAQSVAPAANRQLWHAQPSSLQ